MMTRCSGAPGPVAAPVFSLRFSTSGKFLKFSRILSQKSMIITTFRAQITLQELQNVIASATSPLASGNTKHCAAHLAIRIPTLVRLGLGPVAGLHPAPGRNVRSVRHDPRFNNAQTRYRWFNYIIKRLDASERQRVKALDRINKIVPADGGARYQPWNVVIAAYWKTLGLCGSQTAILQSVFCFYRRYMSLLARWNVWDRTACDRKWLHTR